MAQGTLDIGVVLNGFGFANEQLGAIQSRVEDLKTTLSTHSREMQRINLIPEAGRSIEDTNKLQASAQLLKQGLQGLAQTAGTVLVDALGKFSVASRNVAIEFEQMTISLSRFREEGQTAKQVLGDVIELSKQPMVDLQTAMKSFVALRSTRMGAEDAKNVIIEFSTALASVGASSADLDGVTRALTQIMAKGKVYAEEIYQIAERLPQTRAVMQDVFGTANTEELAKEGIGSYEFIVEITKGLSVINQQSTGLMDTTANAITNFNNQLALLKNNMAGGIDTYKSVIKWMTQFLENLNQNHAGLLKNIGAIIQWVAWSGKAMLLTAGLATAIGTLTTAVSLLSGATLTQVTLVGTMGLGISKLKASVMGLGKGIGFLATAVGAVTSPFWGWVIVIGAIVASLGALFWWLGRSKKKIDETKTALEELNDLKKDMTKVDVQYSKIDNLVKRFNIETELVNNLKEGYEEADDAKKKFYDERIEVAEKQGDTLLDEIEKEFRTLQGSMNVDKNISEKVGDLISSARKEEDTEERSRITGEILEVLRTDLKEQLKSDLKVIESKRKIQEGKVEKARGEYQIGGSEITVRALKIDSQARKDFVLAWQKELQGELSYEKDSEEFRPTGARTQRWDAPNIQDHGNRWISLYSIDDVEKGREALEKAYTEVLRGTDDTEKIGELYHEFIKHFEEENLATKLSDPKYNLKAVTKGFEEQVEVIEKAIESFDNTEFDTKFLVRELDAQKVNLQSQLETLYDGVDFSTFTTFKAERGLAQELEQGSKEFAKALVVNNVEKEWKQLQEDTKDNVDRQRVDLETQISLLEKQTGLAQSNVREVLYALRNYSEDQGYGIGSVLAYLKKQAQTGGQNITGIEDIADMLKQQGRDMGRGWDAFDLQSGYFNETQLPGVDKNITDKIQGVLGTKKATETDQLTSDQINESLALVRTLIINGGKAGDALATGLQNLADAQDTRDRNRKATKILNEARLDTAEQSALMDSVKDNIDSVYKTIISAQFDRQLEGERLQSAVDAEKAKVQTPDVAIALANAEAELALFEAQKDSSSKKLELARERLALDKQLVDIELKNLYLKDALSENAMNRSLTPANKKALQNEINNQVEQNEQQSKILEMEHSRQQLVDQVATLREKGLDVSLIENSIKLTERRIALAKQLLKGVEEKGKIQEEIDDEEVENEEATLASSKELLNINKEISKIKGSYASTAIETIQHRVSQLQIDLQIRKKELDIEKLKNVTQNEIDEQAIATAEQELEALKQEKGLNARSFVLRQEIQKIQRNATKRSDRIDFFKAIGIGSLSGMGTGKDSAREMFDQVVTMMELQEELRVKQETLKQTDPGEDRNELQDQINILKSRIGGQQELTEKNILQIKKEGANLNRASLRDDKNALKMSLQNLAVLGERFGREKVSLILAGKYNAEHIRIKENIEEQNRALMRQQKHFNTNIELAKLAIERSDPDNMIGNLMLSGLGGISDFVNKFKGELLKATGRTNLPPEFINSMLDVYAIRKEAEQELVLAQQNINELITKGNKDSGDLWDQAVQRKEDAVDKMHEVRVLEHRRTSEALEQLNAIEKSRLDNMVDHLDQMSDLESRLRKAEFNLLNPNATELQKERMNLEEERNSILNKAQFEMTKLGKIDMNNLEVGTKSWENYGKAITVAMKTLVEYTEWQVKSQEYNAGQRNIWKEMIDKEKKYNQTRENIESEHVSSMLSIRNSYLEDFSKLAQAEGETAEDFAKRRNSLQKREGDAEIASMRERDQKIIEARNQYRTETFEFHRKARGSGSPLDMGTDPLGQIAKDNPVMSNIMDQIIDPMIKDQFDNLKVERKEEKEEYEKSGWAGKTWKYLRRKTGKDPSRSDIDLSRMNKTDAFRAIMDSEGVMTDIRSGMSLPEALRGFLSKSKSDKTSPLFGFLQENTEIMKSLNEEMIKSWTYPKQSAHYLKLIESYLNPSKRKLTYGQQSDLGTGYSVSPKHHTMRKNKDIINERVKYAIPTQDTMKNGYLYEQQQQQAFESPKSVPKLSGTEFPETLILQVGEEEFVASVHKQTKKAEETGVITSVGGIGLNSGDPNQLRRQQQAEARQKRNDDMNRNHTSRTRRSRGLNESFDDFRNRKIAEKLGN